MKNVFARLGADFFSTIVFLAIYRAEDRDTGCQQHIF